MNALHMVRLIFAVGFAIVAVYVAYDIYSRYRTATGSTWDRLLAAAKDSATMLFGKFTIILAGIVGALNDFLDAIGQSQLKEYVDAALGNPKAVAGVMIGIAVVSMAARMRTLS